MADFDPVWFNARQEAIHSRFQSLLEPMRRAWEFDHGEMFLIDLYRGLTYDARWKVAHSILSHITCEHQFAAERQEKDALEAEAARRAAHRAARRNEPLQAFLKSCALGTNHG